MYAAILTSIETGEYSWESNFDRFEMMLCKKVMVETRPPPDRYDTGDPSNRRYCRDYNRPEGCPKNSPHQVWSGTGPNAVKRQYTTTVLTASSGTRSARSTQRVRGTAPTKTDYKCTWDRRWGEVAAQERTKPNKTPPAVQLNKNQNTMNLPTGGQGL